MPSDRSNGTSRPPRPFAPAAAAQTDGGLFSALPVQTPTPETAPLPAAGDGESDHSSLFAEIDRLRDELRGHDERYHRRAAAVIPDDRYDALKRRLRALEARDPRPIPPDSPTQYVGAPPRTMPEPAGALAARHRVPMLSIDNVDNDRDLSLFLGRIPSDLRTRADQLRAGEDAAGRALADAADAEPDGFLVELKIDGLSLALVYEWGRLVQALTRGDGRQGEDVTANAQGVRGIPERLTDADWRVAFDGTASAAEGPPERFEARGEVYLPFVEFDRLNREAAERGAAFDYANPRNLAVGLLRRGGDKAGDPERLRNDRRALRFFAYQIMEARTLGLSSQEGMLRTLSRLGFSVNNERRACVNAQAVADARDHYLTARRGLRYATDGLVVKVDGLARQQVLGLAATHPNWARAYKFPPERVETSVAAIRVQVGKLGRLTPVAEFTPVKVAGATVTRASLHNAARIREMDLRPGDRVLVEKAGEIIPQVAENLSRQERADGRAPADVPPPFAMPERCPECGGPTREEKSRPGDGRVTEEHFCDNPWCPARSLARLEHFVSRAAMDVDGLGEKQLAALFAQGRVKDPADLYALSRADLESMADGLRIGAGHAAALRARMEAPGAAATARAPAPGEGVDPKIALARRIAALGAPGWEGASPRAGKPESGAGWNRCLALAARFEGDAERWLAASADDIAETPLAHAHVTNLLEALAKSKGRGLARLLFALAIPQIGETAALALASRYGTLGALSAAPIEEMAATPLGESATYRVVGRKAADALATALARPEVRASLDADHPELLAAQLAGVEIPAFAERRRQAVARHFRDAKTLLAATPAEIELAPMGGGVVRRALGPAAAASIAAFLGDPAGQTLLRRLADAGVLMEEPVEADVSAPGGGERSDGLDLPDAPARGKTFVLTGTLAKLTREQARRMIESAGGRVRDSVGGGLDYLVAGEKPGSKLAKARATPGVEVIDEDGLRRLLTFPQA